jgi:hypothetical protein
MSCLQEVRRREGLKVTGRRRENEQCSRRTQEGSVDKILRSGATKRKREEGGELVMVSGGG